MNHYLNVLFECIWIATIIPGSQDTTLYAMKAVGGYDMPFAVLLAIAGAMIGQTFNYFLGRLLLRFKDTFHVGAMGYEKAQRLFHKYGIFLLLFSWVFPGNIVVVISGFLNTRPKIVFPLILFGTAVHYGLLLA